MKLLGALQFYSRSCHCVESLALLLTRRDGKSLLIVNRGFQTFRYLIDAVPPAQHREISGQPIDQIQTEQR
ncbi:hypothetical protein G9444_4247 [Rhodococcus erythropolis]|uniref:Uncharacterized protein n=1 Tax=Rhodococcus erythropolis TaxID=1833 RepID=A0A6G9CY13_RHOER|nr:hypothetical protein G9444_4247 [Rhodococcus erythropolis]